MPASIRLALRMITIVPFPEAITPEPVKAFPVARRKRRTTAILAALFAGAILSTSAQAQDARVSRAIDIYADSCAAYVGAPDRLRAHLASAFQRLPRADEQRLMAGQPGQIWRTPQAGEPFGVFSYDDGDCQVVADDIPIEPMRQAFRTLMTKLARDASVVANQDQVLAQNNERISSLLYTLQPRQGPQRQTTYLLQITQSAQGERRLRLIVALGAGWR